MLPALERFRPQLVLVSCGWDAHARDPLAPLAVSTAGYTQVARLVIEAAARLAEVTAWLLAGAPPQQEPAEEQRPGVDVEAARPKAVAEEERPGAEVG